MILFFKPNVLLHLEGAAMLALSLFLYRSIGGCWALFALLFPWPDISMIGYLANVRLGATPSNPNGFLKYPNAYASSATPSFTHRHQSAIK